MEVVEVGVKTRSSRGGCRDREFLGEGYWKLRWGGADVKGSLIVATVGVQKWPGTNGFLQKPSVNCPYFTAGIF